MIGIEEGMNWSFKIENSIPMDNILVLEDWMTDFLEWKTFDLYIDSDPSNGTFDIKIEHGNPDYGITDKLDEIHSYPNAVYTDWQWWEEHARNQALFRDLDVRFANTEFTVNNQGDVFNAIWSLANVKVEVIYDKQTGILRKYVEENSYGRLEVVNLSFVTENNSLPLIPIWSALAMIAMIAILNRSKHNRLYHPSTRV